MSDTNTPETYTATGIDTVNTSIGSVPFKLVTDLPLVGASSFDIVSVVNNTDTVRVSWESLTSKYISQTEDIPREPGITNNAPYITFAADSTGLYISDGSAWRKSPSYGSNWEDLTDDTRFLLVNAPMELTATEVNNARNSLKLGTATGTDLGLVKVLPTTVNAVQADSVRINNDGVLVIDFATPIEEASPEGVPGVVRLKNYYSTDVTEDGTYAVTEKYVREAISNYADNVTLPIATETSLGAVIIDSGTALTISESGSLSIKSATSEAAGVVFLDESTDIDNAVDSHAASVGFVNTVLERKVSEVYDKVAGVNLGMVRVPGDTAVTIDGVGNIDVRTASETYPGAVTVLGTLDPDGNYSNTDTGSTAVTPQAVTDYVENKLSSLSQSLPVATAATLGAIRVGSSVVVDEDTGVLDITNATPARLGGVYVSLAVNDINSTTVPTESRVLELINSNIPELNTAKIDRYGTVKLSLPDVIEDGAKIGVNAYGQIVAEKTTISSDIIDGEIGIAAKDTLGLVALSSSNTVGNAYSGYGLPIGSDEDGAIYVDASNPSSYATTVRPGLVQLSVSRSEVLPTTNPGIGVDANGQLRVKGSISGGGGSSTSDFNYYFYKKDEPSPGEYSPVYYYNSDTWRMPFVPAASASYPGVVRLGTSTKVEGGFPVGVNESGTLCVAINTTGDGTVVGPATAESSGVVKLGQDDVIDNGLRVGVNANGQLCVASTSTSMTTATFTLAGAVTLSTPDTYAAGTFGVVGVDDTNGKLAVPAATSESYGVVKVGGNVLDTSDPTVALVGRTSEGQLAVKGVSSGVVQTSDSSLQVTLIPVEGSTTDYIVTMTGGAIQLNDGNIVNIEAITEEDNIVITPSNNQTLSLKVFINNDGEPVAKLTLDSSTKVLTCKPFMD